MNIRRFDMIGLGIMAVALLLGLLQIAAIVNTSTLPSAFEFVQAWILIPAAVLYAGFIAVRHSSGIADFVRNFFTSRTNLAVPVTIMAYLSSTWFGGFYEKYDQVVWHNGLALKGFWTGVIAQSHLPAAQHPAVAYPFWGNLLQFLVDHSVYSWFGYVVIGGEFLIAAAFITAIITAFYRPYIAVAAVGTLIALTFNLWFLMSGSAGINALMPYLTAIAATCLIGSWVADKLPAKEKAPTIVLEPIAVAQEKVPANGSTPREPVGTRS